jgi:hypothetical protein
VSEVVIPGRFNGPLRSGNGGYCSGVFGALVEGPAAVDLRSPVPLDTPLAVVDDHGPSGGKGEGGAAGSGDGKCGAGTGAGVRIFDGETLVASARPAAALALEPPAPVDLAEASEGCRHYRGAADGEFAHCFVCGRAREDALGVFAGPVPGRDLVAAPWTPPDWSAADDGSVRPELVAAALDCPAYFAGVIEFEVPPVAFLAHFEVALRAPVPVGEELVAVGWPRRREGRKRWAGSAILTAAGEPLALAEALMIQPRPA